MQEYGAQSRKGAKFAKNLGGKLNMNIMYMMAVGSHPIFLNFFCELCPFATLRAIKRGLTN